MPKRILIIDATPATCALCGKTEELRPYGPDGKCICHTCMKKDEPASRARMFKLFEEYDEIRIKEGAKLLALYRPPHAGGI